MRRYWKPTLCFSALGLLITDISANEWNCGDGHHIVKTY